MRPAVQQGVGAMAAGRVDRATVKTAGAAITAVPEPARSPAPRYRGAAATNRVLGGGWVAARAGRYP